MPAGAVTTTMDREVAIARHRGRKDLPRDHVAIGFYGVSEWIEALEFRVDADLLRERDARKRREAKDERAGSHGMTVTRRADPTRAAIPRISRSAVISMK